jgi:hypothetical protein
MSVAGKDIEYFYTPPKDSEFNELREVCIRFWKLFNDDFGYSTEKIEYLENLTNEGSNFISMVQMIHPLSRYLISNHLSLKTKFEISKRLYGPGSEEEYDCFSVWKTENVFDIKS